MQTERQLFLQHMAQTSSIPIGLEIARAEGCYLYDYEGNKWLDLIAGISVSALGHRHPKILEAIYAQSEKYLHLMVYGEYIQSPQVQYAKALVDTLPPTLNAVYFTNSGTEATEGAMKLAKRVSGRTQFISCKNAYHGSSQGALSLAGDDWLQQEFRPLLPDTLRIRYNNFEDLSQITERTAAVFIEPLQSEAGGVIPDIAYIQALRNRCTETGTLLIFDEIQTGFGRTGTLWAFEQYNVFPDILMLGKALGGGMPLGCFIADQKLMIQLSENPVLGHITTFGGHPMSCAAGLAMFKHLLESAYIEQVIKKENLFHNLLESHPKVKALHGKGLLLALDVENFENVQKIIAYGLKNGLVTDWFLFNSQCVRIAPPLIISEEEIEEACRILVGALDTL
ncbi:MAG: aspartate aminotransferase family protein [Bacteroidia bacterium]